MTYDGGPNNRTVLLFEDYSDTPGFKGTTTVTAEEIAENMTYFNNLKGRYRPQGAIHETTAMRISIPR
jgi:predicted amidohydrolase YtcJ